MQKLGEPSCVGTSPGVRQLGERVGALARTKMNSDSPSRRYTRRTAAVTRYGVGALAEVFVEMSAIYRPSRRLRMAQRGASSRRVWGVRNMVKGIYFRKRAILSEVSSPRNSVSSKGSTHMPFGSRFSTQKGRNPPAMAKFGKAYFLRRYREKSH